MPDNVENEVGGLLRTRRESLHWTQQSLGSELGVKGSYLAMIESGRRKPSLKLIVRLADKLRLDAQQLLVRVRAETRPLITANGSGSTNKARAATGSWQQFINNSALLKHYRVTERELQILKRRFSESLLSAKQYVALLVLIRDIPETSR